MRFYLLGCHLFLRLGREMKTKVNLTTTHGEKANGFLELARQRHYSERDNMSGKSMPTRHRTTSRRDKDERDGRVEEKMLGTC